MRRVVRPRIVTMWPIRELAVYKTYASPRFQPNLSSQHPDMQSIMTSHNYTWLDERGRHHSHPQPTYDFSSQPEFSVEQAWAIPPFQENHFNFTSAHPGPSTSNASHLVFHRDASLGSMLPTEPLADSVNTYLTASPTAPFETDSLNPGGTFDMLRPASATPDPIPAGSFPPAFFVYSPPASDDGHGAGVALDAHRLASEYEFRRKSPLARGTKGPPTARLPGACVRCKRLKMKCTFIDQTSDCVRCESGRHECVVEGRKPRTPGQREQLLRQIRSKNEAISDGLRDLRWYAPSSTPLMIAPAHLPLATEEREAHRDVLTWLEKRPSPTRTMERACTLIDTCELEDDEMRSDDEDDEDDGIEASVPPSPASDSVLARSSIYDDVTPHSFMAKWSRRFAQAHAISPSPEAGLASSEYFEPSPYADLDIRRIIIERELVPEILLCGLISCEEARTLFDLFLEHMNPYLNILDEAIHNAASVMRRSPFLFTVVCAVASRYYAARPDVYKIAIHLAKSAAASAVIDGFKCVENCQAFLILAAYGSPVSRSEECRNQLYIGVAVRMAIELGLDRPPSLPCGDERSEREALNKTRTWIVCWVMDGIVSLESGRVPDVPEDQVIRDAARYCTCSKYHTDFDASLPSLIELLRVMRRFWESVSSYKEGSSQTDISLLVPSFDAALAATAAHRASAVAISQGASNSDALNCQVVSYLLNYCRLLVFWFASQVGSGPKEPAAAQYLPKAADAALTMLREWSHGLALQEYARHAPDAFFTGVGFASTFLLQLMHPHHSWRVDDAQRMDIVSTVQAIMRRLAPGGGAVDAAHVSRQQTILLEGAMTGIAALWAAPH
ncbi:hypothetical protein K488DRAFT_86167 [Vararia minispora EC-137]|uniref:Uncharacterized protein n=1 Tax=Vararia minispora EC-137 TaxID=1314806 RepID=A0ACB8QJW0_9AGAM|nr:hypothetical protein K488DRAFT_86167 [Vararia minispora EC-137]